MSKRSRACDISKKVKQKVWDRDNHQCIICGNPYAMPNAHYIRRSQGGLGIEENVVTLCQKCHNDFDNGNKRVSIGYRIECYLKSCYQDWDAKKLYYTKGV